MTDASPTIAQQRPHPKPLAVATLAGVGLFLVACAVVSLCGAFSSGERLRFRLLLIALAAVSLFLPGWFAFASLRLKWTTGQWTLTPEERRLAHLNRIAKEKSLRTLRFASSAAFRNVTDGIMVVLATINVWLQVRQGIYVFQVIIVVISSAVAASSLWRLLRRYWAAPES
ncbi:hypothetical protein [Granulicella arctica]|uniref:Uncharacterized protein n=1 Tax=Granulicella arctica TaxID=940613 RepID=A0A7Y9PI19_9BACT|nr:hypothetical protein [Granulicella arctica]NYF80115.1 hypothetical protein [Granulicella arctica]